MENEKTWQELLDLDDLNERLDRDLDLGQSLGILLTKLATTRGFQAAILDQIISLRIGLGQLTHRQAAEEVSAQLKHSIRVEMELIRK